MHTTSKREGKLHSLFREKPVICAFLMIEGAPLIIQSLDLCVTITTNTIEFGGVLHGPGYPFAYRSDINCEWKISVIRFTDLTVEGSFKGQQAFMKNPYLFWCNDSIK